MLKSIISGFLLCAVVLSSYGQSDSVQVSTVKPEYDFVYRQWFKLSPQLTFEDFQFQDLSPNLSNFQSISPLVIDFNSFDSYRGIRLASNMPVYSPFINSFSVTNQAHYKLNDRLILGGNSFSANSIYNPLPLNPNIKDMSIRGASMYLQYKISDKFKIGGGFSVTNENNPLIP